MNENINKKNKDIKAKYHKFTFPNKLMNKAIKNALKKNLISAFISTKKLRKLKELKIRESSGLMSKFLITK